jgi:hypothetical protein
MKALLGDLLPLTPPTPFLHIVGWCFAATIPVTIGVVVLIRLAWRRGKGLYDL